MNVLFICSKNQWRSPTAERVIGLRDGITTRSAGTTSGAKHQVNIADIRWADVIYVMEDKHASQLRAKFRQELTYKKPIVLDIPDDYLFMDADLVSIFESLIL